MSIAEAVAIWPMSAPAANAFSRPARTMQRTSASRSASSNASTTSPISSSLSAFSRSGRFIVTRATGPSRSIRTSSLTLEEPLHRGLRLLRGHRQGQPVAGVVDRLVPREVLPEVQVLLRVARRLRELPSEVLDHRVDLRVELRGRHDPVDETPLLAGLRRDRLAHQHDLSRPAVADEEGEPLRRPSRRNRTVLGPDVPDERVVRHHRQVTRHLKLVAAAHAHPVDASERRLADLAQPVVRVLERSEPLPVLVGLAEVVVGPGLEVGADAERPSLAGQHHDADLVVPRCVLARARELAQHLEVEGVQALRPVEGDRRARVRLLVDDALEAELGGVARRGIVGLGHESSAKWTWNGMPISIASLPVAMNSGASPAALNASRSANSHSA